MKNLFNEIAEYIINEVKENSGELSNGLNYVVDYAKIDEVFGLKLKEYTNENIINALCERKEVAEVIEEIDGFDVVIYSDFSENHIKDDEEEEQSLLCLNQGVELWEGFTPITKEQAIEYFNNNKEVFGLDYEGNESAIQETEDFERFEMFVIENTNNNKQ